MVTTEKMSRQTLKVSVSDSESSSEDESIQSENEEIMEVSNAEIESDVESTGSNSCDEEKEKAAVTNEGWADSISKILGSSKPKNKKTLVLSRAKKHADIVKKEVEEKPAFEVVGEKKVETDKLTVKKEVPAEPHAKKRKIEKPSIRIKPNILEKDRERLLSKIATKGVVQLFNAVRNQQKTLEKDMDRSDLSEAKKEKILKKFDKRAFLDTLMGQTKSVIVDEHTANLKDEVKDEDTPRWNALRDDFMMGAKMKDWDKEPVDE